MRREAFERGRFPPVCCKTGQHGDVYSVWEFSHTPSWTYFLIIFGVLPFLVATAFASRRFSGILPMTSHAQDRLTSARRLVWILGIAGFGLVLSGLAWAQPLVAGLGAAVLAAWLITMACVWAWSPNAALDDDGDVVELIRVHSAFVEAIKASAQPAAPAPTPATPPVEPTQDAGPGLRPPL